MKSIPSLLDLIDSSINKQPNEHLREPTRQQLTDLLLIQPKYTLFLILLIEAYLIYRIALLEPIIGSPIHQIQITSIYIIIPISLDLTHYISQHSFSLMLMMLYKSSFI